MNRMYEIFTKIKIMIIKNIKNIKSKKNLNCFGYKPGVWTLPCLNGRYIFILKNITNINLNKMK